MAQSYNMGSKYAEAYLLFNLAIETAESALKELEPVDTVCRCFCIQDGPYASGLISSMPT